MKNVHVDRHNDQIESLNDKDELKSLVINLSARFGSSPKSAPQPPTYSFPPTKSSQIHGGEGGGSALRDGHAQHFFTSVPNVLST